MADDKQKKQEKPKLGGKEKPAARDKAEKAGPAPEVQSAPADAPKQESLSKTEAPAKAADPAKTGELARAKALPKAKPKADPEAVRLKKEEQSRNSRRRNRQIIGFALAILIVVGAVSIVRGGIDLARNLLDSEEERTEYQARFEPMVWFNILPFESVSQVDENAVKQVAIWGVMNEKQDQFERNERDEALVPASEIDQYGTRLFGPDFRFSVHETFEDPVQGLRYTFDEETRRYAVPVTSLQADYLATVVEVKRESGGVRRVVMGYVSTRTGDDQLIATPDYDHPAFYRDFMLRRDGSDFYLYAIVPNTTHEVTTGQPAASSSPAASLAPEPPPASEEPASLAPASQPDSAANSAEEADSAEEAGGADGAGSGTAEDGAAG